jgi:hypothetical protein
MTEKYQAPPYKSQSSRRHDAQDLGKTAHTHRYSATQCPITLVSAFVPSWHACNHSVAAETRLLHWQPFTDSFGRQIRRGGQIANCESSVSQNRFLHTCCVLRHWCAGPNSAAVTVDVPSTIFELESAILWHVVPSLHHHHTPRTTGGDLPGVGGARFVPLRTETHYERRGTDFPLSLPLHINLSPHQHVTDRLLCQLLHIVPITTIPLTTQ